MRRCGCGRNGSVCIIIISFAAGIIAAKFFPYSLFIILMLILLLLIRLTKLLVTEGENEMKVVVVRSPKLFSGILRLIFGIKRQEQTT